MSQARGSHYLKFGAEYRYHVGIGIFPNLMNLNFYPDSDRQHVSRARTPRSTATRTLRSCWAWSTTARRREDFRSRRSRAPFVGTFIHDDWKITPPA